MTNYKVFKITNKQTGKCTSGAYVFFFLDGYVTYECLMTTDRIFCVDAPPFNTWQVGDYLEIDLDITRYEDRTKNFGDLNVVRKVSSSSEVIRGQSIAERLIREVNSQPPGKVEFEHRIEHRDRSPERFIYRKNY